MPSAALQRLAVRQLLTSRDCFGTTLLVWVMDRYGDEALAWLPDTIRLELEQDLGQRLPGPNFDKLMAAVAIRTGDEFYQDVKAFISLANALSGEGLDPGVWSPAEVDECCWAITEAYLLRPPDQDEAFSDEIRHYLAFALKEEGYATAPDVLKIAIGADATAQLRYDYADDPEMFAAIFGAQEAKTKEIEAMVAANLRDLVDQLNRLPLQHGSAKSLMAAASRLGQRLEDTA